MDMDNALYFAMSRQPASQLAHVMEPEPKLQLKRTILSMDDNDDDGGRLERWTMKREIDARATNFSTIHNFAWESWCFYCVTPSVYYIYIGRACNTTKFYCSNKFILMSVLLSFDSRTHKYKLQTDEL